MGEWIVIIITNISWVLYATTVTSLLSMKLINSTRTPGERLQSWSPVCQAERTASEKAQKGEQAWRIEWPELRPVCMRHKEQGEWWVMGTRKDFTNSKKNRVITAKAEVGFFLLSLYPL